MGWVHPSPVQLKSIPVGRFGSGTELAFAHVSWAMTHLVYTHGLDNCCVAVPLTMPDLIAQAKSGTGKTGVFAIVALSHIDIGAHMH